MNESDRRQLVSVYSLGTSRPHSYLTTKREDLLDEQNRDGHYSPMPPRTVLREVSQLSQLPVPTMAPLPSEVLRPNIPTTYTELRRSVEQVVLIGRQQIDDAWLRTYHETGRLIHEHLLLNKDRADYGAKLFKQLAADTGIEKRTLYQCGQFFRLFPIVSTCSQLSWGHYRLLCQVANEEQRIKLQTFAIKHEWTCEELAKHVRPFNATLKLISDSSSENKSAGQLLTPKRGSIGLYRVTARDDGLAIDVGFKLYLPLSPVQARVRKAAQIVRFDGRRITVVDDAKPSDLFTYRATVRRVIDGDTLAVGVALPYYVMEEKLRLRGIDAPEIDAADGKAAKQLVETLVRGAKSITLRTTKPDKYDRYLADVFVETSDGAEVFINNALLEQGLAERKDAWEFSDWEKQTSR
jgi:endonuclease YncB( thermonuclease family)